MFKLNKSVNIMVVVFCVLFLSACQLQRTAPEESLEQRESALQPKEADSTSILLNEILELANIGMTLGSQINVLESKMEQVKAEWGEPDKLDQAGKGSYATYDGKRVAVGFNEAGEIFDVRSYANSLSELTPAFIKETIGQPDQVRNVNNEEIYVYELNQMIELKFIIPNNSKAVHHLSILNQDRVNVDKTKEVYVLDIKGQSNQLTASAWESMNVWRKQIVAFAKEHENVYINGPNKKQVALTFDDGPDDNVTSAIIDILDKYRVKGNFFFLGSNAETYPDVVIKAYDGGHIVASHSYNHVELTKRSQEEIQTEIEQAGQAIKSIIGKEPAILRTPYGETNKQVAAIAKQEEYSIVLWSIDTLDWSQKEASNIVSNVMQNVRNGDIILMHSDSEKTATVKALPKLIEALQKEKFEIVDLETLLNVKAYQ
ncbi:peptidoglycan/xylan/chitin deacetylase (PgdA/CDA1 family) [Cytobacillus eiseniae]|uniref:Peptidoglycan/xylan/chitin deacetylase (PgdA/CDA1 family) n=1 Tax=Cytobacillus eiseniae TaxID=762947 RepID=A0ABS4RJ29_9BACI|nr:polysaccharide deacetylase family protein [Cytobacillus eiseniae]MBP2242734.1 peptidoglycan/xylan/chitin deacetylase (PgdA/CDA1 family) [Cytobacillus eiseniae]